MKNVGRPKSTNPKIISFGFRCTIDEAYLLKSKAYSIGMTPGAFSRYCALNKRIPNAKVVPEINRKFWYELSKIGNNLNQLTRNSNQWLCDNEIKSTLIQLNEWTKKIQLTIVGIE